MGRSGLEAMYRGASTAMMAGRCAVREARLDDVGDGEGEVDDCERRGRGGGEGVGVEYDGEGQEEQKPKPM